MVDPQRAADGATPDAPEGLSAPATRAKRTPGQVVLAVFRWIGIAAVALAVLGAGVFGAVYATTPVPDPNKDFQTNVSTVFFRDGKEEMGTFIVQNRVSIPFEEMPENVKQAIVAGENETFWTDPGISVPGLARAVITALGPGDTVGGSTITQQYVKVLYLTQEKTLTRKLTEIIISLKVGQDLPKEKILEGYLNTVYFGRGAYGIQAASRAYFDVDAKNLTMPQAIALSAIINSPGNLDPAKGDKHRADLLERYQYIINQMVKLGHLTEAQKSEIYTKLPDFPRLQNDSRMGGPKGFLLNKVQGELKAAGFTDDQINGGGLQIITTVDSKMQEAAVKAAQNMAQRVATPRKKDPLYFHPAIASLDVKTGGILAMYSGPDYTADYRSWAEIPRPTGSTFKPYALVAGLRDGATLADRFNGDEFTPKGEKRPITNGGADYGPVTLEEATTKSINSAYVDLVMQMKDGPMKVAKAAEDAGVTNPPSGRQLVPSIPLGFSEVSPVDAARALGTIVNEGKRTNPHIVAEVRDVRGKVVYQPTVAPEQKIEADVAQNAAWALTNVVQDGTARVVSGLGYPIAGKTGTYFDSVSKETKATWFIGATKQISTAVVLSAGEHGYSDIGGNVYGSTYTAPTWLEYMRTAMQGMPKERFAGPTKIKNGGKFRAPAATRAPATRVTKAPVTRAPEAGPTTNAPAQTQAPAPTTEPAPEPTQAPPTQAPPTQAPPTQAPPSTQAPKPTVTSQPTQPKPSATQPKPSVAPTSKAGAGTGAGTGAGASTSP